MSHRLIKLLSPRISALALVLAPLIFVRCGDSFMKQKVTNEAKGSLELATTADAAGNYTGAIDPNSTATQVLRASGSLAGSAIALPPGALGINLNITIGSGETLASSDTTQQLGLGGNTATAAGPSVSFVPSQNVQATNPFTLSIPVSGTSLAFALANSDNDNLVVMYKWMKVADGVTSYAIGIITRDQLTIGSKSVQFQTDKFGTFQLAVTQTKITEPVNKPTAEPPVLKSDASNPLVGVWSQCYLNGNGGYNSATDSSSSTPASGVTNGTAAGTDINVNSKPPITLTVDGPVNIPSSNCVPYRVSAKDGQLFQVAIPDNVGFTVQLVTSGGPVGNMYSDSSCGTAFGGGGTIPAGSSEFVFFYKNLNNATVDQFHVNGINPEGSRYFPGPDLSVSTSVSRGGTASSCSTQIFGTVNFTVHTAASFSLAVYKNGSPNSQVNSGAAFTSNANGSQTIPLNGISADYISATTMSEYRLGPGCFFINAAGTTATAFSFTVDTACVAPPALNVVCDNPSTLPADRNAAAVARAQANAAAAGNAPNTGGSSTANNNNNGNGGGGRDNIGIPQGTPNLSSREYVKFSASTFIHSRSTFSQPNCAGAMLNRIEESGTYKMGAAKADATTPISIIFAATTGTILTDANVQFANSNSQAAGCGFNDWTVGNPKDLSTSAQCSGADKSGDKNKGPSIFKIKDNNLYFDDGGSGVLNTKDFMSRQQ